MLSREALGCPFLLVTLVQDEDGQVQVASDRRRHLSCVAANISESRAFTSHLALGFRVIWIQTEARQAVQSMRGLPSLLDASK